MVLPVISAIGAAAAGGVEAAGISSAIGTAAEITATTALKTAVEVLPKVANPLMAEAVDGVIPNVAGSSANSLKGVEAVAKMQQPIEAIKPTGDILETPVKTEIPSGPSETSANRPVDKVHKESPKTQVEVQDAIYQQKLNRLSELRATRDAMDIEIKQLEGELGEAKGISPQMKAMIAAAALTSGLNNQIKEDKKQ
jgi:hypothetical protein